MLLSGACDKGEEREFAEQKRAKPGSDAKGGPLPWAQRLRLRITLRDRARQRRDALSETLRRNEFLRGEQPVEIVSHYLPPEFLEVGRASGP